ncbi:hypothetical protein ABZ471_44185 [Streptomyces sp. NPDC005728]|uniref:hypothetical protein n=1 Tax=Streptomyces sp. NPDC005728 TaxID=3157054 RepID=UPI0033C27797
MLRFDAEGIVAVRGFDHPEVIRQDDDFEPVSVWEWASGIVEEYLRVFGGPEQLAAWRENRPYVADVTA